MSSDIFPYGSTAHSVQMASGFLAMQNMRNMHPRWMEMRFGETIPEAEARWAKEEAERPAKEAREKLRRTRNGVLASILLMGAGIGVVVLLKYGYGL